LLLWDDVEVGSIDKGHDEGYIGISAIRLGVGEYRKFCSAKGSLYNYRMQTVSRRRRETIVVHTDITRYVGIQARENDRTLFKVLWNAWIHLDFAHTGGYGSCLFPICSESVCLPCRPR